MEFDTTMTRRAAGVSHLPGLRPPGALSRDAQKQLVKDATGIIADICGDPSLAKRTWVLLTEAAEGGWGIGGTAFGREEFTALAAAAKR